MCHKKKGFTLVEVLVVILVSTIVFALVGGTMVFISTSTNKYIEQSKDIDTAKNIEKYLRTLEEDMQSLEDWNNSIVFVDGDLLYKNIVIFSDTNLKSFNISSEDEIFIKCYMTYPSGMKFEFIVDQIK